MKKIWEKHAQLTSTGGWMNEWMEAMATACQMGNLAILQWMMEHTSGRAVIAHYKKYDGRVSSLLYFATGAGHLDVMEYLYQQGAAVEFGDALLYAIRRDNMDAVKWLLASFPSSEKLPEYCVLVEAARHGRVEMLQYFQSAVSLEVPGFPGSKPSSIPQADTEFSFRILVSAANRYAKGLSAYDDSQWRPTEAMDDAAANGQLEAVKWLHNNRSEGCTAKAMDEAAANGQLEVLKWLHANRSEGYTDNAIFYAARNDRAEVVKWLVTQSPKESTDVAIKYAVANGNLVLVQWLHSEANTECSAKVMICAAKHGHLKTLKYLYSSRPKDSALTSCAVAAETALARGHFRVAHWCLEHFPVRRPTVTNVPPLHPFESLLLLRRYYPEMLTVGDLATIREKVSARATAEFNFIAKWLNAQVSGL